MTFTIRDWSMEVIYVVKEVKWFSIAADILNMS